MSEVSEFRAFEEAAKVLDRLDAHRRRQVVAMMAERYGFSLQPARKKTPATPNRNNRSEFAAAEDVADLLDDLTPAQHAQAVTLFAAKFELTVVVSHKPPSRGKAPGRKRSY